MDMPRFTAADGAAQKYLELADKALQAGRWDKAAAYAAVARAYQVERDEARRS